MDDMVFASTLIWYHTHRQTNMGHAGTNKQTQTEHAIDLLRYINIY